MHGNKLNFHCLFCLPEFDVYNLLYLIFVLKDVIDKSRNSKLGQRKTIFLIAAIIIAAIILVVIFLIIPEENELEKINTNYLPPDCYSLNGKIICPKS